MPLNNISKRITIKEFVENTDSRDNFHFNQANA